MERGDSLGQCQKPILLWHAKDYTKAEHEINFIVHYLRLTANINEASKIVWIITMWYHIFPQYSHMLTVSNYYIFLSLGGGRKVCQFIINGGDGIYCT